MTKEQWKKIKDEIGYIQLYQRGICIVIWFGNTYQQYWDYTQKEAIHLFKKKYGIKGKVEKAKTCPFILN
jgi:hypothetical protein